MLLPTNHLFFLLSLIYGFFKQYFGFFMFIPIRENKIFFCAGNVWNIWLTIFPLREENKAIKNNFLL